MSHRSLHIRVAAAWLRRARQSPEGGRFQQFLDEMGDTKVRTPGRNAPVQINTLHSSDKPEDRSRVQEEYQKWSAGGDGGAAEGSSEKADGGTSAQRAELARHQRYQEQLIADAVKAGVSEEEARAAAPDLKLGDGVDVVEEFREALEDMASQVRRDRRRQSIRDTADAASQGVADAERALTDARKSKDKDRIADAEEALRAAEEALYWSQADRDSVDRKTLQEQGARLDREAAAARATAQARQADVEDLQGRIAEAELEGDDVLAATLTADLVTATTALEDADLKSREASKRAETHALATRRRFAEMSRAEFDRTWARAKRNPGVMLYNADGKAERYDPSTTDAAYDVFMTLLGEQLDRREIPDMDETNVSGDDNIMYDSGDVWEVDEGWSAKNSKRKTRVFDTIDGARAFAKTAWWRR